LGNQLLKAVSRLRATLLEMEADLGLTTLTEAEKTVLAAAVLAADRDGIFEISVLQSQSMVAQMFHSTFFRVIRTLGEKGLIDRMTDEKRSLYRLKA
jgi:DNA-binding MarR family transcriptional regulator